MGDNGMKKYQRIMRVFLICAGFALNFAGKIFAEDITISLNTAWQAGAYTYDNVLITNGATLTFNGAVTLNAQNLTIDLRASISSDAKGYPAGQGSGAGNNAYQGSGAGHGGKGGRGYGIQGSTYGSSFVPTELGSGGGASTGYGMSQGGSGGGAIQLNVQNTLTLNGIISVNGSDGIKYDWGWMQGGGGSAGSVYITAGNLAGSGSIFANGGRGDAAGGGGRIAVYYCSSSFTGNSEAKGGTGNNPAWNGEDGTTAFIDQQNNILYAGRSFRFQENDSPFNFNKVILNNSQVTAEGSTILTIEQLLLNNSAITLNDTANLTVSRASAITNSSFSFTGAQSLKVPSVTLNNSTLLLSGKETLSLTNLTLNNNSVLTNSSQGKIELTLPNLSLDSTSSISANAKGYPAGQGPGVGEVNGRPPAGGGAGYGGKGGDGAAPPTGGIAYGSAVSPVDLGSGGGITWQNLGGAGGGAIKLTVSDNFILNGKITANGEDGETLVSQGETYSGGGGSGGSVYIITSKLAGSGLISANGGKGGGWAGGGGGGGGGRIAVYYKTSTLTGRVEAKGGTGSQNGEDGTIVFQPISLDTPITTFNLIEKSSTTATSQETLTTQSITLNNVQITSDLTGTLNFTNLELTTLISGAFSSKGFLEVEFTTTLEDISYQGNLQGVVYTVPSENKLYLKANISGLLISGIAEGTLTESVPGSGIYDKYQATWKLNRLSTDTLSATLNLEGTISSQSSHSFTSGVYLYQANYEGNALGSYTGPLSAVLTHLRLTSENEYKGKGFSIISYNSLLGQGEGYSYNKVLSEGIVNFQELFKDPLLGVLQATLDETKNPKTLSGTIERLDLGATPAPDLKVNIWGPTTVSPGQTFDYIIELRNDGLKAAENFTVVDELPGQITYRSSTGGGIYKEPSRNVVWNFGNLGAKTKQYLTTKGEVVWGEGEVVWLLPMNSAFGNIVSIPKENIKIEVDPAITMTNQVQEATENKVKMKTTLQTPVEMQDMYSEITVLRNWSEQMEPTLQVYQEIGGAAHAILNYTRLPNGSVLPDRVPWY